jgi:hypothetical protein
LTYIAHRNMEEIFMARSTPITLIHGERDTKEIDGIIVTFEPVTYPQLRQVRRRFVSYDLKAGSLNPDECELTGSFWTAWMMVTCDRGYSDGFAYLGGDFGMKVMAEDRDQNYLLLMDFDSVPVDPLESYHEGMLSIRITEHKRGELHPSL